MTFKIITSRNNFKRAVVDLYEAAINSAKAHVEHSLPAKRRPFKAGHKGNGGVHRW